MEIKKDQQHVFCRRFSSEHPHWGINTGYSQAKKYLTNDSLTIEASCHVLVVELEDPFEWKMESYSYDFRNNSWMLLNNASYSDVEFIVGTEKEERKFFGHRFMLGSASPAFKAMFLQPKDKGLPVEDVVKIPDIHPTAFMTLLRYIYRKETIVDKDFIQETLNVAQKYDVLGFVYSLAFLINVDIILDFLSFVLNVGLNHSLYDDCWDFLRKNTDKIVKLDSFSTLPEDTLKLILKADRLTVKEVDLFNAYVKWADQTCIDSGLEVNDKNRRKTMKHLKLIRFPVMTAEEFILGAGDMNILTLKEKFEILSCISIKKTTEFPTDKRF